MIYSLKQGLREMQEIQLAYSVVVWAGQQPRSFPTVVQGSAGSQQYAYSHRWHHHV